MPKPKGGKKPQEDVDDMDVDVDEELDEEFGSKPAKGGKGNNKKDAPAKGKQDKKVQEDSDEDKPKKGGKQQQKKKAASDDEDERPQKAKGKKGSKKQDSDAESEEEELNHKNKQSSKKGNEKKNNKQAESDEEDAPKRNKKGGKKGEVEEEAPQKKGGKQQKKGGKKEESEDEEEAPQAKKQDKKKGGKKEESDEEEEPTQKKGGKAGKKGNKKAESEDEEPVKSKRNQGSKKVEEPEEDAPKKGGKQQKKKGNKKDESDEEEEPVQKGKQSKKGKKEESDEEEVPQKGKQTKKGKKEESDEEVPQKGKLASKKSKKEVSEDEESEEEPVKKSGKQTKKGNKKEESDEEPKPKSKQAQKKGGKKIESEDEEEEEEEEKAPPKGKQTPKKGNKKVESEEEEEEEEEESEEEVVTKKGGKPQSKKAAVKEKKEEEPEEKIVAAGMVSKKNKKNKKKGGKKAESDDSEPEAKGGFAGLEVEDDDDEDDVSKPNKGKKKPNKPAGNTGFAELDVEDEDEEEAKPKSKGKANNKPASGGFAGLEVEGDDDVTKGIEALSIKEKTPKQPKAMKSADDTRSKKQLRMEKKNAARLAEQPVEVVREKTAEELEDEANERFNRAQEMKGREPPPHVHLRNSEDLRSKLGNDIKVDNYTLQVPGRTLLTDASFTLAFGHRYGFVGRNGLGKSSLLQKIADRDGIQIAKHLRVLYVEQEVPGDDTLPIDYVLKADAEREWLLQEEKVLIKLEAADPDWMDNPDEKRCYGLKEIYERLRDIESEKAVSRASAILVGLGFDAEEIKTKPSREFSGGWRMRISLARALFCRPEVLLLDEPTNHLDLHACFWLERYLSKWKSTLLVVSHEATFLNEIVDHIIEIRNKKLQTYKGDYWTYQKTREVNEKTKEKLKDKTDKEKARLKEVIQRTAGKAGASGKDKKLAKIEDVIIERDDPSLKVSFPDPDPLPPPIYQFQDVSFGYDPSKPLFKNLEFGIDMDSRIALVGLNGVGKSTLMKLMGGELKETAGYISRNRKVRIARFSQHSLEQLNPEQTPAQYLDSKFNIGSEHTLRQHLGRFGITGNLALNKIDTLSGGQKSRVVLAELAWAHPHILLLDEPSNHLDLDAIEALAQGLNAFSGGVVLISHNQRLISLVCNEIWVVTKAGTVDRFNGEFDDYKEDILAHMDFAGIDEDEEDEEKEKEKAKEMRKAKKAEKEEREDARPKKGKKSKK